MIRIALTIAVAVSLFAAPSFAAKLEAGAAVRVVTPEPLLPVSGGIGAPTPVKEKRGELYARALVFAKGKEKVAMVNVDFLGWPKNLGDMSRALIDDIAPENVIIAATHTHSAPDPYGFPHFTGKHGADLAYLTWVTQMVAEAVNEAHDTLEPVHLKINVDEAEGKIAYNYYAPQLYDPRCGAIQAIAAGGPNAGKPVATLVNYASHPEVLGTNVGILSADYVMPLYDRIEAETGSTAVFMNGALGGMVTADNRYPDGHHRTWEECVRIGNTLAEEALRILSEAEVQEDPALEVYAKDVTFEVENKMMQALIKRSPMADAFPDPSQLTTTVNVVTLGTAQILTIPGEALPNVGYYLKRHMPGDHDFLFGLANDAFGYLMTKEDFNSFKRYDYISRTSLGEHACDHFVDEALELVAKAKKPDGAR